jgi:hypothetical protein
MMMTMPTSLRVWYESEGEDGRECSWGDLNQDFWRHWEAYNEDLMYAIQDDLTCRGQHVGTHDFGEYRITVIDDPDGREAPEPVECDPLYGQRMDSADLGHV